MEDVGVLLKKMDFLESEIKNTTDRACVIVAAAYIDDLLRMLLESFLTQGSKADNTDLFDSNGPLSTFSSKIKLSYRLGLISQYEFQRIEWVRKIRNKFAHQVLVNSLDDDQIKGIVCEMTPERKLLPPKNIPLLKTDKGIDIVPYVGLNEEDIDLRIEGEYAGAVVNEILPEIPNIDMQSCRDRFEKTIACITHNLTFRLAKAISEQRKIPKDYDSALDAAKSHISNLSYKCFVDQFTKNQIQIKKVEDMIVGTQKRIEKVECASMVKEENDFLKELEDTKKELEQLQSEIRENFLFFALQKFSVTQIEKALKKENLI